MRAAKKADWKTLRMPKLRALMSQRRPPIAIESRRPTGLNEVGRRAGEALLTARLYLRCGATGTRTV